MSKRSHRVFISDSTTQTATAVPEDTARPAPDLPVADPAPASEEEVAVRAYERWLARGRPLGSPDEDWYEAERDLLARSRPT